MNFIKIKISSMIYIESNIKFKKYIKNKKPTRNISLKILITKK